MFRLAASTVTLVLALLVAAAAQSPPAVEAVRRARISETVQTLTTYPFNEPNLVPALVRDPRLYPYHYFEGYAHEGVPREWKVVHLENDLIEVFVLPGIGGKIWGARVKKNGHEFIYRNEVVKFRNIALRGPWTSGGIEFNFGIIGHTPSTATPVDYQLKENPDGSVSCIVGTMDLPSRTEWRVEVRLPADKGAFETDVLWHNPTPLEQPYYNWMTAAAFAREDLEMYMPGNAYLQHSGGREPWPVDERGRFLPRYGNNDFGGNKSFHVVGALHDYFGGYYHEAGYGFGHWARHEEMPGQKLWLWALSRAGGIWEDLLTDTDGQYIEFQAGRLFVQYSPGEHVNPISQAGFDPYATDRWTETWFPIEGLGGLSDASPHGAMAVRREGGDLTVAVHAFGVASDTLRVWSGERLVHERQLTFAPLEPVTTRITLPADALYRVELPELELSYHSDPTADTLSRPFDADPSAQPSIDESDRLVFEARELARAGWYEAARPLYESALARQPWHRDALLGMADLEYRRARYAEGLAHATRALQLDTYDPDANFIAGNLYRGLGRTADARDAFGMAARAMAYRSAANVQLAELALARSEPDEAERYARIALDFNRQNLSAWGRLATIGRVTGRSDLSESAASQLLALDPLNHLVRAEAYLSARTPEALRALTDGMRSEFPDQTLLELAIGYVNRGRKEDALALLEAVPPQRRSPLLDAWRAYLANDATALAQSPDLELVFPYRQETLPVLAWAAEQGGGWRWKYLHALNLWALDRSAEAGGILHSLGTAPDFGPLYVARAALVESQGGDPEADLQRAEGLAGDDRTLRIPLIGFYQRKSRWKDALAVSSRARERFPEDFNIGLMHARSLLNLGRPGEAISILGNTRVLPSEHAGESHRLYVQAHVMAALDAIEAGELDGASAHLAAALEWPEHLGQGRPYEPEERLVRFLMAQVEERRGKKESAQRSFEAVVAASGTARGRRTPLDLLSVPALRALGRPEEASSRAAALADSASSEVRELAAALASGERPSVEARDAGDLDLRLIVRALSLVSKTE